MTVLALLLVSCAPVNPIKSSLAQHIVEVTANNTDFNLQNLANWCYNNDILMLWYDFDQQPTGFTGRTQIFGQTPADKNVYLNNIYVGNYDFQPLTSIQNTIQASITNLALSGSLILYLKAKDPLGTSWDLILGEGTETKAITNYVFVEFQAVDASNKVYKVTKVQSSGNWKNFYIPKGITDISSKGFAFFRIDDDVVVDARVIYP